MFTQQTLPLGRSLSVQRWYSRCPETSLSPSNPRHLPYNGYLLLCGPTCCSPISSSLLTYRPVTLGIYLTMATYFYVVPLAVV